MDPIASKTVEFIIPLASESCHQLFAKSFMLKRIFQSRKSIEENLQIYKVKIK